MSCIWWNTDDTKHFSQKGAWDNSYRPYLLQALELTAYGNVLELGCGDNSTPLLQAYCREHGRALYSYDNDREWADKFGATFVGEQAADWEKSDYAMRNYTVAFIDHSPPIHRPIAVRNLLHKASIIIMHDTQPNAEFVYGFRQVFPLFKYIDHYCEYSSWATIASNVYDITRPK